MYMLISIYQIVSWIMNLFWVTELWTLQLYYVFWDIIGETIWMGFFSNTYHVLVLDLFHVIHVFSCILVILALNVSQFYYLV